MERETESTVFIPQPTLRARERDGTQGEGEENSAGCEEEEVGGGGRETRDSLKGNTDGG